MSGTMPGRGNSIRNVLESIRKDGFLEEADYPFTDDLTESQFFAEVPQSLKDKALNNLKDFRGLGPIEIEWECLYNNPFIGGLVDHKDIKEALKYSPVITTGYAWSDGPIYVSTGQTNHCFIEADHAEEISYDLLTDDSYPFDWETGKQPDQDYIKKMSVDYNFYSAYKITGTLTQKKPTKLVNFKSMFSKMVGYMDDKGLNVFWLDKAGKQKIDITTMAEKALYMSAFADGDIKKTSWPALQPVKDNKYF